MSPTTGPNSHFLLTQLFARLIRAYEPLFVSRLWLAPCSHIQTLYSTPLDRLRCLGCPFPLSQPLMTVLQSAQKFGIVSRFDLRSTVNRSWCQRKTPVPRGEKSKFMLLWEFFRDVRPLWYRGVSVWELRPLETCMCAKKKAEWSKIQ